ncbi:MAG: hypothetical protein OEZ02_01955 [Anaerolineae bacterium]|nr:hypothetical protein [Anaerolineae bacterium]
MTTNLFDIFFLHEGHAAHTTDYMYMGFAVIFGVMLLHIFSLYSRSRNLQKDMALLKDLEAE